MSVIEFHIWPDDNPVGEANKLGVITDEDVVLGEGGPAIWYEPSLHGLGGSAGFSISRHSALATSTIIREGNVVRVKVPEVSSDYLPFGWCMKSGEFHLIDSDEAGGENITIEGPGLLHKLATGSLWHSSTVSDQPFRGSADRDGVWWWTGEPYGAELTRIMEEGRHSPYPDPAEAGSPLEFFDITFSRTQDSAAAAWPNIDAEFQVDIGTDLMTVADRLRESGNLYIIADASDVDALTVHCYQTYGDDLTGSFGAGTVRFEKGVNIATELVRRSEAGLRINKLLLRDKDGAYSTETLPGFSPGDVEQWGFWDANQTNDDTLLNAIGLNVLRASQTSVEALGLEHLPGKVPAEGLYLAGLHYKPGDSVTLHTGTDPEDYDEADQIVMAVKVSVRDGTTDDTAVHAQRSLKIEPQLNYYSPRYGNSNVGTGPMGVAGCRCLELCPALTPGTETASRLYFTSAATPLTGSAGWTGGTTDMTTHTLAFTATGANGGHASWDAVNQAAASFGLIQGRITLSNAALLAAVQSGGTFRIQAMIGVRHGVGINESVAREYLDGCLRVWRPSTTSFIGTMLSVGDATNAIHADNDPAGTIENRSMVGSLTGVPSAIATDVLVVELGLEHTAPVVDGAGGSVRAIDSAGVDLPEDDTTQTDGNAWVELRTLTAPTGTGNHPDLVGTDNDAARCDHTHQIVGERAPTPTDDGTQGYPVGTFWVYMDGDVIATYLLIDNSTGSAVWVLQASPSTGGPGSTTGLPWFIVTDPAYGATGDGTTDDTAAINLAIAALNTAGAGVLYFPAGDYLSTGALTAITVPCRILGDGAAGGGTSFSTYSSRVVCSSGTAVLFTIQAHAYSFEGLAIMNNQSTPSAGAGIAVTASGDHGQFRHITVEGFYINIDIQEGAEWRMAGCHLLGPELYALKIRHVDLPDGGDWAISDSWFTADGTNATAAIWQESGGGGKISNVKINKRTNTFTDGIHVAITNVNTSILEISNTSIENVTGDAVDISTVGTATFSQVVIDGLQVGLYGNNTGRAVKITAAAAGGTAVAGGISGVSIDGLVAKTDGTAREAVELTNVDVVTLGEMTLLGFNARYTQTGSTNITDSGAGGAAALDDLTDVTLTSPAEGDMLRFDGTAWVNTPGRWEPVTTNPGGGPELVWDGDDLLMTWVNT